MSKTDKSDVPNVPGPDDVPLFNLLPPAASNEELLPGAATPSVTVDVLAYAASAETVRAVLNLVGPLIPWRDENQMREFQRLVRDL